MTTHEQPVQAGIAEQKLIGAREQIHQNQIEHVLDQQKALTENEVLKEVIREVATLRGRTVDIDYKQFNGPDGEKSLRASMRAVFDFRTKKDGSYGERWEADENAKEFLELCSPELADKIYAVAEFFHLTGTSEPSTAEVEAGVALGGGGRSPFDRTMFQKELIDAGKLKPNYIVALGSSRAVDAAEIKRAGGYAEGAQTEYDLMVNAAKEAYNITVDAADVLTWKDQKLGSGLMNENKVAYLPANGNRPDMFILSSAMLTNPYRQTVVDGEKRTVLRQRTDTADTFAMLGRMANFKPGDKVVAITNAHFRPFQGAAAAGQLAKYGVETEVVGFDPKHFDNLPKRSDELLQEMLTTADSLAKTGYTEADRKLGLSDQATKLLGGTAAKSGSKQ